MRKRTERTACSVLEPIRHTVLYVHPGHSPYGPQQIAENVLEGLSTFGLFNIVAAVGPELASSLPRTVGVVLIPEIKKPLRALIGHIRLHLVMLRLRPNIIHFNIPPTSWEWLSVIILAKIIKAKIVYSFHGGILLERNPGDPQRALFKILCHHCFDVVIANSPFSSRLLVAFGVPEHRLIEIPNGIRSLSFQRITSNKLKGDPALLFAGRVDFFKGADLLIDMMDYICAKFPNAHLHIIGPGLLTGLLSKQMSERGLISNVTLYGYLPHLQLIEMYSGADMCIFPYRCDTFGIAVLEAMSAGRPVVVSDLGNLPNLVEHMRNGIVCNTNPLELATSVMTLCLDTKLREEISEHNRRTAERYDWAHILPLYAKLYLDLIRPPKSRS